MKLVSLFLLCLASQGAPSGARLSNGSAGVNGVSVNYQTYLEPGSPAIQRQGGGVLTENNIIKRHLCNFDNHTYFGYDLTMEPLADGRFQLRFAPLTITPAKMAEIFRQVPNWRALPLPGGPATLVVKAGETVALDLFTNPSTGQKVTEYLVVKGSDTQEIRVEGQARDFGAEDAIIALSAPQVSIDGKATSFTGGGISGSAVWADLPGHGRFVFSLLPRPEIGMKKMGEVRGTALAWRYGGHDYHISNSKPVTLIPRAYNLYVFAIPKTVTEFALFAGPRPDDPIRQR